MPYSQTNLAVSTKKVSRDYEGGDQQIFFFFFSWTIVNHCQTIKSPSADFEFIIVLLLHWLPIKARKSSLLYSFFFGRGGS